MDRREFMEILCRNGGNRRFAEAYAGVCLKNSREDAKMTVLLVNGSPHEKG